MGTPLTPDERLVIDRIVSRAKPLTPDQSARLSVLLRPGVRA